MYLIKKAPIIGSYIAHDGRIADGEVVFPDLQDQRDADHRYYLREFVKWLNEHGRVRTLAGDDIYQALIIIKPEYESLLKEGEAYG